MLPDVGDVCQHKIGIGLAYRAGYWSSLAYMRTNVALNPIHFYIVLGSDCGEMLLPA